MTDVKFENARKVTSSCPSTCSKKKTGYSVLTQIIVNQLTKRGWPCILQEEGGYRIHHYNNMLDILCKGYSVEDQKTQTLCGEYINEVSLNLSSVFEK